MLSNRIFALVLRLMVCASLAMLFAAAASAQGLPPIPVPPENPVTPAKAVLGKILFWDEQLSSDHTVACGTCHLPAFGGSDGRPGRHPGPDGESGTADDIFGSLGMVHLDMNLDSVDDPIFGLDPQVTMRSAPSFLTTQWAPELLLDGAAASSFIDPQTGLISIVSGGALESQAIRPVLSSVEMGHVGRTWEDVSAKLVAARPLELASNLPPDVSAALASDPSYPDLFSTAFGDPAITAERIAFAIATYERTLVPDQTPWDRFVAGELDALTPAQQQGLHSFEAAECSTCHPPPLFTDHSFRNLGLRPAAEDIGREAVTGLPTDRGSFRVSTLRNVGLKTEFMHNGRLGSLSDVVAFYADAAQQFPENLDPLMPVALSTPATPVVIDFLTHGLTDPRVADGLPPFDHPSLHASFAACMDGLDNDGDGLIDLGDDLGCSTANDTAETDFRLSCDDGLDNDEDGSADHLDPDCTSPTDAEDTPNGCGSHAAFLLAIPALLRGRSIRTRPMEC